MAGGQKLPSGIPTWGYLHMPLFTPSTKAKDGHDVNISAYEYNKKIGVEGIKSINMFSAAYIKAYRYALGKGIVILDTKFEGLDVIADEVLTPDSSRFTTKEDLANAIKEKRDPVFYDKEIVRQWGKTVKTPFGVTGINNLDPENEEHVAFVHDLEVPEKVINETSERYLNIYYRLTL